MVTMQGFANFLDVNIGEEFFIKRKNREETYIIDPLNGLCRKICDNDFQRANNILPEILTGKYKIIKNSQNWKPKYGDPYFSVEIDGSIEMYNWTGAVDDLAYYIVGNCFRSEIEAKMNKVKLINHLKLCYEKGQKCNDKV